MSSTLEYSCPPLYRSSSRSDDSGSSSSSSSPFSVDTKGGPSSQEAYELLFIEAMPYGLRIDDLAGCVPSPCPSSAPAFVFMEAWLSSPGGARLVDGALASTNGCDWPSSLVCKLLLGEALPDMVS